MHNKQAVPEYKPDEVPVRGKADFYSLASAARKGNNLDSVDFNGNPFWLVWSRKGSPTVQHFKKDEALAEAERLSKKFIDIPFYVAEANIGYLSHALTTKIHLIGESDEA